MLGHFDENGILRANDLAYENANGNSYDIALLYSYINGEKDNEHIYRILGAVNSRWQSQYDIAKENQCSGTDYRLCNIANIVFYGKKIIDF